MRDYGLGRPPSRTDAERWVRATAARDYGQPDIEAARCGRLVELIDELQEHVRDLVEAAEGVLTDPKVYDPTLPESLRRKLNVLVEAKTAARTAGVVVRRASAAKGGSQDG